MGSARSGQFESDREEMTMSEHKVGTREEWQVARDELAKLEAAQAERNEEIKSKRRDLPWVRVEEEYEFDTDDGKKTLAELFDGRSQLLAYNIMFGHDYTLGARPVRRAVLRLSARANAEGPTRRASRVAEGRVPGLTRSSQRSGACLGAIVERRRVADRDQ